MLTRQAVTGLARVVKVLLVDSTAQFAFGELAWLVRVRSAKEHGFGDAVAVMN